MNLSRERLVSQAFAFHMQLVALHHGMSYGHTTRRLQEGAAVETMQQRSDKFIGYADWRPPGELLAEKGKKIPGYQGGGAIQVDLSLTLSLKATGFNP